MSTTMTTNVRKLFQDLKASAIFLWDLTAPLQGLWIIRRRYLRPLDVIQPLLKFVSPFWAPTHVSCIPLLLTAVSFISKFTVTTHRCELSHLTSANPPPLRPPLMLDHILSATWSYTNYTSHSYKSAHTYQISTHRILSARVVIYS